MHASWTNKSVERNVSKRSVRAESRKRQEEYYLREVSAMDNKKCWKENEFPVLKVSSRERKVLIAMRRGWLDVDMGGGPSFGPVLS